MGEPAFKVMGQLDMEITDLVNKQLDNYLSSMTKGKHPANFFQKHAGGFFKSRLLHYFPITEPCKKQQQSDADIDNFCGWHLDHGALTVLLSPMYLDSNGNKVEPPSDGGLFSSATWRTRPTLQWWHFESNSTLCQCQSR